MSALAQTGRDSTPQLQLDIGNVGQIAGTSALGFAQNLAKLGVARETIDLLEPLSAITVVGRDFDTHLKRSIVAKTEWKPLEWMGKAQALAGKAHATVRIGFGLTSLEEKLLVMKSGGNILGLFSSLSPYTSSSDEFAVVITQVYMQLGVPHNITPGTGQIAAVKNALNPFMALLGVPDAIKSWIEILNIKKTAKPAPAPSDFPKLLDHIRQVMQAESQMVLNVYGQDGAAWMAYYCQNVLGIGVCVVSKWEGRDSTESGTEIMPYNCTYLTAKVLLHIDSPRTGSSLQQRGDPENFISHSGPEKHPTKETYDCGSRDFLLFQFPQITSSPAFVPISHFVAAQTIRTIGEYAICLDSFRGDKAFAGFSTYYEDSLPEVQGRGLSILRLLGFQPKDNEFYKKKLDEMGASRGSGLAAVLDVEPRYGRTAEENRKYLHPLFWDQLNSPKNEIENVLKNLKSLELKERGRVPFKAPSPAAAVSPVNLDGPLKQLFRRTLNHICDFEAAPDNSLFFALQNAIRVASVLAFTDWIDSIRTLSSAFYRTEYQAPLFLTSLSKLQKYDPYASQEALVHEAIAISTGAQRGAISLTMPWSQGWIGRQFDGVVALRYLACPPQTRLLNGCLVSFHIGHISVRGETCTSLWNGYDADPDEISKAKQWRLNYTERTKEELTQPLNLVQDLVLQTRATREGDIACLYTELFSDLYLTYPISPSIIAQSIYRSFITKQCKHETATPLDKSFLDEMPLSAFEFEEGFRVAGPQNESINPSTTHSIVFQQVNQNRTGQWAACHISGEEDHWVTAIVQRDSCLNCLFKSLAKMVEPSFAPDALPPQSWTIVIIPDVGRVARKNVQSLKPTRNRLQALVDSGRLTMGEATRQLIEAQNRMEQAAAGAEAGVVRDEGEGPANDPTEEEYDELIIRRPANS